MLLFLYFEKEGAKRCLVFFKGETDLERSVAADADTLILGCNLRRDVLSDNKEPSKIQS